MCSVDLLQSALDERVVRRLEALESESPGVIREVAALYLYETRTRISRLVGLEDLGEVALLAHKLKGSSAIIGANSVKEIASRIERDARSGGTQTSGLVLELRQAFDDVRPEVVAFGLEQTVPVFGSDQDDALAARLLARPTALIAPAEEGRVWEHLPARRRWQSCNRVLLDIVPTD